jgi:hypothetical protein
MHTGVLLLHLQTGRYHTALYCTALYCTVLCCMHLCKHAAHTALHGFALYDTSMQVNIK